MRRTDAPAATVRAVRGRDDWRCARCAGPGPLSTQHRVARGMGGSRLPWINLPGNLLTLCGSGTTQCHGWVEHHPTWAQDHGYAVRRSAGFPEAVPVWTWRGWVLLGNDGALTVLPDWAGVGGCDCGCRAPVTSAGAWDSPAWA